MTRRGDCAYIRLESFLFLHFTQNDDGLRQGRAGHGKGIDREGCCSIKGGYLLTVTADLSDGGRLR